MAGVVHITEAEAARNFSAVIDRVLAGEEIVVRRGNLEIVVSAPDAQEKTLARTIELAQRRRSEHGLSKIDADYASDMERIHTEMNRPLDGSKWD